MKNFIFYLTDHQLELFSFKQGQIIQELVEWDALDERLKALPNRAMVQVVLDVVDEDLLLDWVPSLLPWEKQQYQKRLAEKTKQKGALYQRNMWTGLKQVTSEGRKDELLISSQVFESKLLTRLKQAFVDHHILFRGLHSSSFLLQELFKKHLTAQLNLTKSQREAPLLLVARMDDRHYRQCFFYKGYLRLTRIVDLDTSLNDERAIIDFLAQEVKLATRFIYNQKFLPLGTPINYVILDRVDEALLNEYLPTFESIGVLSDKWDKQQNFFDVLDLVDQISLQTNDACYTNAFLAQRLGRGWRPSFYDDSYIRVITHYSFVGYVSKLAILFLLVGMTFLVVSSVLNSYFDQRLSERFQLITDRLQLDKTYLISTLSPEPSPVDMQAVVQFADKVEQALAQQPYGIDLNQLAHTFSQHRKIKIESIQWQSQKPISDQQYRLTLKGLVYPFEGQFQPVVDALNSFIHALEHHPHVSTLELKQNPFNQDQRQALTVNPNPPKSLPFEVDVIWLVKAKQSGVGK